MPSRSIGARLLTRRLALRQGLAALAAPSLAVAGLSACAGRPPPLRLALNSWVGYALLFMAQDMGHPREADLRLIEFPSNTASLLALANGDVEAAALTLEEVLLAREGGLPIQAALVFDESHGADAVLAHPRVPSIADLKGRRIGVESSAVGALMLSQVLSRAQIAPSDVHKVSLPADQHVLAYADGEVDAVITFEPMASQLVAQGARKLMDSSAFPGLIVDVLAVRTSLQDAHLAQLRQTIQGHFMALQHLQSAPLEAARALAPHQQLPAAAVLQALSGIRLASAADNRAWLAGPHPKLVQSAQLVGRVMHEAQLLRRPPDLSGLCASQHLPELA